MKMEPVEYEEKLFPSCIPGKELISKICRNSYSSIAKKKKKGWGKEVIKIGKGIEQSFT